VNLQGFRRTVASGNGEEPGNLSVPGSVVDPGAALAALKEAQQRVAEQRAAAERVLEETRALEQRLAAEAEKARAAEEHEAKVRLRAQLDDALTQERLAAERLGVCEEQLAQARSALETARSERERLEGELRGAEERAHPFDGEAPSLAVIDELRVLEAESDLRSSAARRLAERRASDAVRAVRRV
jgi:chromosome segregation ATPase